MLSSVIIFSFLRNKCYKRPTLTFLSQLVPKALAIVSVKQSWALSVFFNFFNNKKWFFKIFMKLITYFWQVLLKSPLPVKLTWWKMPKKSFFVIEKIKNTEGAQLWHCQNQPFSLQIKSQFNVKLADFLFLHPRQ